MRKFTVRVVPYIQESASLSISPHILFDDPDSCYHARRIIYIAQHNMRLPYHDPLLAYPRGATPIWSPFYDWICAFPAYILSLGKPSDYLAVRTASIMNVIFGLMQLFFLGLLLFKIERNLIFASLGAFLVGISHRQTVYTSLKMIDHNSLSLLLFVIALYQMYRLMTEDRIRKSWLHLLPASMVLALSFWTWPGAYLYIGVLFMIEVLYMFLRSGKELCHALAIIHALAAIFIFPLAVINYRVSKEFLRFEYVSFFTVLFMLALSLIFVVLKNIYDVRAHQKKVMTLIQICAGIILLIVISYFSLNPLLEGFKYAEAQNKWLSTIQESKPILYIVAGSFKTFTLDTVIEGLSYLVFLFPVVFFLLLARIIKIPMELYCMTIIMSVIFSFLVLKQLKYSIEFAIPYGIVLSIFFLWIYQKFGTNRKAIVLIALTIAIGFSQYPHIQLFQKDSFMPYYAYQQGYQWLREELKVQESEINSRAIPPEGIMAPWDFGHHLQLYSNVGTIADNFGFIYMEINPWEGFYDMAKFFLAENENEAISILQKYKCKYVVVPSDSSVYESYTELIDKNSDEYFSRRATTSQGEKQIMVEQKDKYYGTIGFRLSEIIGSSNPADDENMMNFMALKHFKLLYQLPGFTLNGRTFPPGSFNIFQYVSGATLELPLSGASSYKVEALILTPDSNHFYYRQTGTLNEKIIVPYPTVPSSKYPYAKSYKVITEGMSYYFDNVTEKEVHEQ